MVPLGQGLEEAGQREGLGRALPHQGRGLVQGQLEGQRSPGEGLMAQVGQGGWRRKSKGVCVGGVGLPDPARWGSLEFAKSPPSRVSFRPVLHLGAGLRVREN